MIRLKLGLKNPNQGNLEGIKLKADQPQKSRDKKETRVFTEMALPYSVLIDKLKHSGLLWQPIPIKALPHKRQSHDLYYKFHTDNSHDTDEWLSLKHLIEDLVQRGSLLHYCKLKGL